MNKRSRHHRKLTSPRSTAWSWPNSWLWLGPLLLVLLLPAAGATAQSGDAPTSPPEAERGLVIHRERCANCHGERGLGDGELAADLANPPAPHASPEYLRTAVPAEMYAVITNGRVANSMPPFGPVSSDPLSDDDRWNVVAALYALGTPAESVESGREIYDGQCLACHGPDGGGDGPEAAALDTPLSDLGDLAYWSKASNEDIYTILQSPDQIDGHDFNLDEDESWVTVDFLRTFSYQYVDALARFRPLEAASISGQVMNGTTGEPMPAGSAVNLFGFLEDIEPTLTMTTTVDADGLFRFDLADVPQEWIYRVSLEYGGVAYSSDFGELSFDRTDIELPITVYELTSDPGDISIGQLHIFLSFGDGTLDVSELYVVNNAGQEVFVGESGLGGGTVVLDVPGGAQGVSVQRGFQGIDVFLPLETIPVGDQDAVDIPVRPGSASLTLLVEYGLPYEDGIDLNHLVNYPASGVNLLVPDAGVSLEETNGWANMGQQSTEVGVFTSYVQSGLPAGDRLIINLTGEARPTAGASAGLVRDSDSELLAGAAALLIAGVAVTITVRRWRQVPDLEEERRELLLALAELDDEYAAGLLGNEEYQREREELKAELLAIWEE